MNNDQIANTLSLTIPYFFIALWILVPIAIIWGVVLFVKRYRKNSKQ